MQTGDETKSGGIDRRTLGGIGFTLADAALFAHGLLDYMAGNDPKGAKGRMVTGLGWGIGGLTLAKYGSQPVPKQLERLENKLASFLQEQGVSLDPDQLRKAEIHEKRSFGKKIEEFIYDYPTEVLNAYYGVAATGLISSGLSAFNNSPSREKGYSELASGIISPKKVVPGEGDVMSGLLVIAGALVGIFVKEKPPRELENAGPISKLFNSKPLAWSNGLFLLNNYGTYKAAMSEREESLANDGRPGNGKPHRYMLRFLILGCYLISNILVGSGSKKAAGKEEDRTQAQTVLIEQAAEMLSRQPQAEREQLAQLTADYLVKQRELRMADHDPQALAEQILDATEAHRGESRGHAASDTPSPDAKPSANKGNFRQKLREEELENNLSTATARG